MYSTLKGQNFFIRYAIRANLTCMNIETNTYNYTNMKIERTNYKVKHTNLKAERRHA